MNMYNLFLSIIKRRVLFKITKIVSVFLIFTLLIGCSGGGSNNSDPVESISYEVDENGTLVEDANVTETEDMNVTDTATVILVESEISISENNAELNIDVTVIDALNSPYKDGNVSIIYPDDVRQGRDIGFFAASTVSVENGHANFSYIGPKDLSADTSDIVFGFYHNDNPSEIVEFKIKIVASQIPSTQKVYTLSATSLSDNFFIPIETNGLLTFFLADNKNILLDDEDIIFFTIENLNPHLATLIDNMGNRGDFLTIPIKNSVSVNVETSTISGLIPLKVQVSFKDVNGNSREVTEIFNVTVLSGPPSAISLSYAGTSLEKQEYAKFVEKWVLSVTDRYNNLVNTNPSVSMGMLAGYSKDSSNTPSNTSEYLYYTPADGNASLDSINDSLSVNKLVFDSVDITNDYLVTFGSGYTYNASGKWSISDKNASVLYLIDDYNGENVAGLGFAVGNNFRQDKSDQGVEWIGNVYPETEGNYTIPSTGSMRINVEYDYYLTGKDVMFWVNLVGKHYQDNTTVRIGEAKKITLRANGITSDTDTQVVPIGAENVAYRFNMSINNTIEWYRHANFVTSFKTSDQVSINSVSYSSAEDNIAYVIVNVTNNDLENAGFVSIDNPLITKEF